MTKTSPEELISAVAEDFIVYLKAGTINPNSFIQELNLNIRNFRQLLRIHFVLQPEVVDFARRLPQRLQRLKVATQSIAEFMEGEIRGRIDWSRTLKQSCYHTSRTTYSCLRSEKSFGIKENLVLKRLLQVIHQTLINDLKVKDQPEYTWLKDWLGESPLYRAFEQAYLRNVYLRRVTTTGVNITPRMLRETQQSRYALYREAALLLEKFQRIEKVNIDKCEAIELLTRTFISPSKDDVLFELYWVLMIIKTWAQGAQLSLLPRGQNLVASWQKGNFSYSLYHDSNGSSRVNFNVALTELENSKNLFLQRLYKSRTLRNELARRIFGENVDGNYFQGRPDILVEVCNSKGELVRIVIGEVKYTSSTDYAVQGLTELLDYMHFAKGKATYLKEGSITGVLFLDQVPCTPNVERQNPLVLTMAGVEPGRWPTNGYTKLPL